MILLCKTWFINFKPYVTSGCPKFELISMEEVLLQSSVVRVHLRRAWVHVPCPKLSCQREEHPPGWRPAQTQPGAHGYPTSRSVIQVLVGGQLYQSCQLTQWMPKFNWELSSTEVKIMLMHCPLPNTSIGSIPQCSWLVFMICG